MVRFRFASGSVRIVNFSTGDTVCSPNTYMYACKGVFNPNIPIFQPKSAEGLHFSAFPSVSSEYICTLNIVHLNRYFLPCNSITLIDTKIFSNC